MHRAFRKRMQIALDSLRQKICRDWAEWSEPTGGYLIWLKLKPVPLRSPDWENVFASHGVMATPESFSFYSKKPGRYLRLSISTLNEEEIVEGINRLSNALRHIYSGR